MQMIESLWYQCTQHLITWNVDFFISALMVSLPSPRTPKDLMFPLMHLHDTGDFVSNHGWPRCVSCGCLNFSTYVWGTWTLPPGMCSYKWHHSATFWIIITSIIYLFCGNGLTFTPTGYTLHRHYKVSVDKFQLYLGSMNIDTNMHSIAFWRGFNE